MLINNTPYVRVVDGPPVVLDMTKYRGQLWKFCDTQESTCMPIK